MRALLIGLSLILTPSVGLTADKEDTGGTLNPPEMTVASVLKKIRNGETNMMICATGYYLTKSGQHNPARELFKKCAKAGYTGAMTWMSQMDDNGLGAKEDATAAAKWDKKAADAGDPVGKFNYGLDLLRGRGVAFDEKLGRKYIDQAAAEGLKVAKRLKAADYDLDEVTPDADNWKYEPKAF